MEMTLLLALMLQRFKLTAIQTEYEMEALVTLRPKGELLFKL